MPVLTLNLPTVGQQNINSNVVFLQLDDFNLHGTVNFNIAVNSASLSLPVSINFVNNPGTKTFSLPSYIFFGSFHQDFNSTVNFHQLSTIDFKSSIQISKQIVVQPTGPNINFNDFHSSITIKNNLLGAGGINVYLSGPVTSHTTTDATGFFEFINLPQGNYIVQPYNKELTFTPNYYELNINLANAEIIFSAEGILSNQAAQTSLIPSNSGQGCFINQIQGVAGTFAINGIITLQDNNNYQNVLTIITDEATANNFRETLGL